MFFEAAIIGYMAGSYIYHRWIEDHPRPPRPADIQLPRVAEGAPLPMIYGRVRVRSPVRVWFGNYLVPGDDYNSSPGPSTTETADHYSIDLLFVVGFCFYGGQADLLQLWTGDALFGMVIDDDFGTGQVFRAGAGAVAPADASLLSMSGVFYKGSQLQDVTSGAPSVLGAGDVDAGTFLDGVHYGMGAIAGTRGTSANGAMIFSGENQSLLPAYRNQVMVYVHVGMGATPELPTMSLEVVSLSTGTPSDMGQSLASDADPAAVLYDLLVSLFGKLGLPADKIDLPSFQAASLTLFNEGHGYSRSIEQAEDALSIINDIIKQIDACWYEEPTTGKIVLKLVRNDYSIPELDDINPDNASPAGSGWYQVQGWSETLNQVRVTFTDRSQAYGDGLSMGHNMANIIGQGGRVRSTEIHYVGCCTEELAKRLASRELGVVSRPSVKVSVIVDRTFYEKRIGDVVTFTWPELGVDHMVMRIAAIDFGQLHAGQIRIDMMRDIFDVSVGAF